MKIMPNEEVRARYFGPNAQKEVFEIEIGDQLRRVEVAKHDTVTPGVFWMHKDSFVTYFALDTNFKCRTCALVPIAERLFRPFATTVAPSKRYISANMWVILPNDLRVLINAYWRY